MSTDQVIKNNSSAWRSTVILVSQLTLFFMIAQAAFAVINNYYFFTSWSVVHKSIQIPKVILPGLIKWLLAEILIYLVFIYLLALISFSLTNLAKLTPERSTKLTVKLWIIAIIFIMSANQIYFPNSQFSDLTQQLFPAIFANILLYLSAFLLGLAALLAIAKPIIYMVKFQRKLFAVILLILLAVIVIANIKSADAPYPGQGNLNIIFIGIDSLRTDHVGFYGGDKKLTPNLDNFLKESMVFMNATTPLARTYSAWASILTGNDPLKTNARNDLMPFNLINLDNNLATVLHKKNYFTAYAIDDNRFSHIDEAYGFDKVIGSGMDFNNFLIGNLNDFPLSNLLINTFIGKWLFPYNYANRQSLSTYDPHAFIKLVAQELPRNVKLPVFLNFHLCLPHAPYSWSEKTPVPTPPQNAQDAEILYDISVKKVDEQFAELLQLLAERKLLYQSIVVVFSDHGESLGPNERLTIERNYVPDPLNNTTPFKDLLKNRYYPESLDFSTGHGTDVLSPHQNNVVLAFRFFNGYKLAQKAPDRASLVDINPTIQDILHLTPTTKTSGISLMYVNPYRDFIPDERDFYIENGFTPEALEDPRINYNELIRENARFFFIDPTTGYLTLNTSAETYSTILENKQYALIHYPWMLALYPTPKHDKIGIIVNMQTGAWTDHLHSKFALTTPAAKMLNQLQTRYHLNTKDLP